MSRQARNPCPLANGHSETATNLDERLPDQEKVSWSKSEQESVDNQYMDCLVQEPLGLDVGQQTQHPGQCTL